MKWRFTLCSLLLISRLTLVADDAEQSLLRLKMLLDKRLITQTDYDTQKELILKGLSAPRKPAVGCVFSGARFNWLEWDKGLESFSESAEANVIVKELVDAIGAAPNFIVRPGKVDNAAAVIEGTQRYILYSPAFITETRDKAKSNWSIYSIMAHELGHHFNGHTLLEGGSRPDIELEADEFSGHLMARMGAALDQAEEAMKRIASEEDGPTHPGKVKRLAAIERGWRKGKNSGPGGGGGGGSAPPANSIERLRSGSWTNSIGMIFVPVPGTDGSFCIWETRVQDFEVFVRETGHDARRGMISLHDGHWNEHGDWWGAPGFPQSSNSPVCGVNWNDARAFCQWLTDKERKTGLLPAGAMYRLPTDLEWSAAVGLQKEISNTPRGKDSAVRDVYPWGGQWPPTSGAGNYAGDEMRTPDLPSNWEIIPGYRDPFARTAPVGSFKPSLNGIYDLGGNVWEWCEDPFDGKPKEHVLRGGSWYCDRAENLLSSSRYRKDTGRREADCGFRCVLATGAFRPSAGPP